jgi:membrane fusion protein, heavy metal efflux system
MNRVLILSVLLLININVSAHEGEDHGKPKKEASAVAGYFSIEALSDKYELLLKYGELAAGKPSSVKLFVSDAKTNRPIDSAAISIAIPGLGNDVVKVTRLDTGIYELAGIFPENKAYNVQVTVNSSLGPDLLQLSNLEIGKKFPVAVEDQHAHWYANPLLWAVVGLIGGMAFMYLLMRGKRTRTTAAVIITICLLPIGGPYNVLAHGGEEHGDAKDGGTLHEAFVVEKESQFLFQIRTQPVGAGMYRQSNELLGTIIAAPQGKAVIQTPQTGKIVSLLVRPGQTVSQGQTLVTIEQQVDAGTQVDMISQRNNLNAEVQAARAQYDRLKSIEDIVAKKDLTEAKARCDAAVQNLRLFNANVGKNTGSSKLVALTAPISGVVGTFNYAIGAVVNSGETLFDITNLNKIYVETQAFLDKKVEASSEFVAFSTTDTTSYRLRLISIAQSVNASNQAERMLFEVLNPAGKFRIGENVRVLNYTNQLVNQVAVPSAAVTDVNGKPAVFIKDKAEQYSISFIQKGEANPMQTIIVKGVESGERVVTENVYQMKMIYLGQ